MSSLLATSPSSKSLARPASAPPPEPAIELTPEELAVDAAGDSESGASAFFGVSSGGAY